MLEQFLTHVSNKQVEHVSKDLVTTKEIELAAVCHEDVELCNFAITCIKSPALPVAAQKCQSNYLTLFFILRVSMLRTDTEGH